SARPMKTPRIIWRRKASRLVNPPPRPAIISRSVWTANRSDVLLYPTTTPAAIAAGVVSSAPCPSYCLLLLRRRLGEMRRCGHQHSQHLRLELPPVQHVDHACGNGHEHPGVDEPAEHGQREVVGAQSQIEGVRGHRQHLRRPAGKGLALDLA